ncbi:MAG: hypothetical protein ACTSUN_07240 [Promethearchaeota archaeon]
MSSKIEEKIKYIKGRFQDFSNYIELPSFRSFLLFTLTSKVPSNILAQLGLGGNRELIILPHDPLLKIYYQKINLYSIGPLIIYVRADPISEEFVLKRDNPIIKEYLNPNEEALAFHGKEKFILPKISDGRLHDFLDKKEKITLNIDDLFHSAESFIASSEPNILFVLDGKDENEPDILFSFNMMPQMPLKLDQKILMIDVYVDNEHKTRDMTYLKREEDFTLTYLKGIKEVSHADLYKSSFSLILHVKSLSKP